MCDYLCLCLCLCCCLCCCLWLLLLFVVAIRQCLAWRGLQRVSRKRNVPENQFLEFVSLSLEFWCFWDFFHFQKDKNRENVQSGQKERRVLWLIGRFSRTFLSLILLLINILIKSGPTTLIVAQKDLPSKHLKRIRQNWESLFSSLAFSC